MGRQCARSIDTKLNSHLFEDWKAIDKALVYVELVAARKTSNRARVADIDIRPGIPIYICDGYACAPCTIACQIRIGRCIFKSELTLVDEQLARHHVPGNKYILQAIPVKISNANSMAIVQILILEYMDGIIFSDGVHKV